MDDRDLSIDVYGQTPYAYYLSDFSLAERARLWFVRNGHLLRLGAIAISAGALGASLSLLFS